MNSYISGILNSGEYEFQEDYINISSALRDIAQYPNTNRYTITLNKPFSNICHVELVQVELPYSFYRVNSTNQNMYWRRSQTNGTGTFTNTGNSIIDGTTGLTPASGGTIDPTTITRTNNFHAQVHEGNYTGLQLADELQRIMDIADPARNYLVQYDPQCATGRFYFAAKTATDFDIGMQVEFGNANFTNDIAPVLGFDTQTHNAVDSDYWVNVTPGGTETWDNTWATGVNEIDGYHLKLGSTQNAKIRNNYVNLMIDELQTSHNYVPTGTIPQYFARIPLDEPPGGIIFRDSQNHRSTVQVYNPQLGNLNKLTISWKDDNNDLIDFHKLDHSFTLKVTTALKKSNYGKLNY